MNVSDIKCRMRCHGVHDEGGAKMVEFHPVDAPRKDGEPDPNLTYGAENNVGGSVRLLIANPDAATVFAADKFYDISFVEYVPPAATEG